METKKVTFSEIIKPEAVDLSLESPDSKDDLFHHMIAMLFDVGAIGSKEEFLQAIYERESLGPTYMGEGIAIPHGKSGTVKQTAIAFCRCDEGFYYHTDDGGGEVDLIFMLAIPGEMSSNDYIRILSRLARLLVYPEFVDGLRKAKGYDDIISSVEQYEPLLDQ